MQITSDEWVELTTALLERHAHRLRGGYDIGSHAVSDFVDIARDDVEEVADSIGDE